MDLRRREGAKDASEHCFSPVGAAGEQHNFHNLRKMSASAEEIGINLLSDWQAITFLILLYTIQGIPMGLGASVPFLLHTRASYKQLGLFSLVSLPFSLKILWAPLVDSKYIPAMGRRKSWLIPIQLICGCLMVYGGRVWVDSMLVGPVVESGPNVSGLTLYFLCLYFLMATQDIVVDGWALTMLRRENRTYSSSCNAVGQTLGVFIAHAGFLALHDPTTCNKWLRSEPLPYGIVTLGSFLRFWGWVVLLATVLALFFDEATSRRSNGLNTRNLYNVLWPQFSPLQKAVRVPKASIHECEAELTGVSSSPSDEKILRDQRNTGEDAGEENFLGARQTYSIISHMVRNSAVLRLSLILLTCRFAFAPIDALTGLKLKDIICKATAGARVFCLQLVEAGISKEQIAFFGPFLLPFAVLTPLIVGRLTSGEKPLRIFLRAWWFRLFMCPVWLMIIKLLQTYTEKQRFLESQDAPSFWMLALVFVALAAQSVAADAMFSAQMSFFARVADSAVGGTYMTFLNTVTNLGTKWPTILIFYTMDSAWCASLSHIVSPFVLQTLLYGLLGAVWMNCGLMAFVHDVESLPAMSWKVVPMGCEPADFADHMDLRRHRMKDG